MKLSETLRQSVSPAIVSRGRAYYFEGRVIILRATEQLWETRVRGTRDYQIRVEFTNARFQVSCDCEYFAGGDVCKHIFASVLALDVRGYLPPTPDPVAAPARRQEWQRRLDAIESDLTAQTRTSEPWPLRRQVIYLAETPHGDDSSLILDLRIRDRNAKDSGWNQEKDLRMAAVELANVRDPLDRRILAMLGGAGSYWSAGETVGPHMRIRSPLLMELVPLLCETGRFFLAQGRGERGLKWDSGDPWQFELRLERSRGSAILEGYFRREAEEMDIQTPAMVASGLVFTRTHVAPIAGQAPMAWIRRLRREGSIAASEDEMDSLVERLLQAPTTPKLKLPADVGVRVIESPPVPMLQIEFAPASQTSLAAALYFEYDGIRVSQNDPENARFLPEHRALIRRDMDRENQIAQQAEEAGLRVVRDGGITGWRLPARQLPSMVRTLTAQGWIIQADGRAFRMAGASRWSVSSGVDWFELEGAIDFGDSTAEMPDILLAARKGERYVRLGDGSLGLLPEEWLERFGHFATLGETKDGKVRFRRNQALLLDALLAAQEHVSVDEAFRRVKEELESFEGIEAAEQPEGFTGTLRHYQREGVGWMEFLERFGLGGCLADDMGVGKTAQVLARLEKRRAEGRGTSLAVVPRSLIFNWRQEAERFTPQMRVLDHTGADRSVDAFAAHDLVLTTYGTLRRDIEAIREFQFDYAILDEAQSIRNAATDSAKAARLINSRHRLALTGTPVENRLADLWSIFEFLNPGMLGSGRAFDALAASSRADTESETRTALGKVLRPFILRRTKHQVASELPEKTEQTIHVELEPSQRRLYNEIRDHYRGTLLRGKESDELRRSKMQVLEALLRLRQAACHPGLIDSRHANEGSAKVDFLVDQLAELAEEGNKALVFSQFTSLLSIVRTRLDRAKVAYEYLDGRTRDRQARVERFQNDPECPVFLISLKAGGLGLNLTAAEYVFLLDPWWNPAVEAQAIDRAHRIGQTKPVVAYRLIAKDTVEEKVQELQNTKRNLVKAIIGDENRLIADLKRDDLELLLS